MTRRLRCFWDDEAVWFYFELDTDGCVIRQVELQEPGNKALAAASLAEWQEAQSDGRLAEYESVYGLTAELPISEWEGHAPQWLSANEFEARLVDRPSAASGSSAATNFLNASLLRPLIRKLPSSVRNRASSASPF
ncbi:hypothetical protein [Streptomyces lydicus]|uniref:hypothetical protein n=1 Tax=Streptomyces lydicus TaxID=47763 RepID=UPI0037A4DB6C